jgi:hypothetical protein
MTRRTSRSHFAIAAAVIAALVLAFLWLRRHERATDAEPPPNPAPTSGIDASGAVIVRADAIDPANDGRKVSVAGDLVVNAPATDTQLGIEAPDAVVLLRFVEMLQWQERCRGTDCTYLQVWSPQLIDSAKFRESAGHQNPARLPMTTARFASSDVRLGAFKVDAAVVGHPRMNASLGVRPMPMRVSAAQLPSNLAPTFRDVNGALYAGDPEHRKIGDMRVSYRIIPATRVGVVGIQRGDRLIVQKAATPDTQVPAEPPAPAPAKGES